MSQANTLVGAPEQLERLSSQFNNLYQAEDLVVIGRFGTAAIYETFGFDAPPVPLLGEDRRFRKLEVMATTHMVEDEEHKHGGNLLDTCTTTVEKHFLFDFKGNPALVGPPPPGRAAGTQYLLNATILAPHERSLNGMPVRTLSIGAHLLLTKLVRWGQPSSDTMRSQATSLREYEKLLRRSQESVQQEEEFTAFADTMRESHPEEFPGLGQEMTFRLATKAYAERYFAE